MSDEPAAQQLLWDAIHDGPAAQRPGAAQHFRGDGRLDAAGRLNIYADMYEARLLEALEKDYPWTAQLIGDDDDAFGNLVKAYVRRHPLVSFTLAGVGEKFPEFLAGQSLRADLPEVAKLEWMRNTVAIAEDAPGLQLSALGAHGEAVVQMRCLFVPTMQHCRASYDVCAVVDDLAAGHMPPSPAEQSCMLVAWRNDDRVFHTSLSGPAAEALQLAAQGRCMAEVCDAFATSEDPARAAFAAIGAWFTDGWVKSLEQVC